MPLLFSYGTLQDEKIQLSTFGRLLVGQRDELPRFEPALVKIDDPAVVAAIGKTHHPNVRFTGRDSTRVRGMVFDVTDAELVSSDAYETAYFYKRIAAVLASGRRAWVYVDAKSAPQTP